MIIILASVNSHVVIAGIYKYLLPLSILYYLPSISAGCSSLAGGVT